MRTRHRNRVHGDGGASLAIALVFILMVGLMLGALLPYTKTGVATAGAVRDVRTLLERC